MWGRPAGRPASHLCHALCHARHFFVGEKYFRTTPKNTGIGVLERREFIFEGFRTSIQGFMFEGFGYFLKLFWAWHLRDQFWPFSEILANFHTFCNICKLFADVLRNLLIFQTVFAKMLSLERCRSVHILESLKNAVKRICSCKMSFWYSRERARQKIAEVCKTLLMLLT